MSSNETEKQISGIYEIKNLYDNEKYGNNGIFYSYDESMMTNLMGIINECALSRRFS